MADSRRRSPRVSLPATAVVLGALAVACSGEDETPARLLDGSAAPALPVELEGVTGRPVLTRVRVVPIGHVEPGSRSDTCVQQGLDGDAAGEIVERTGVVAESVTFGEPSGRGLYGCDNTAGPREEDRHWCGVALGRLYSGHLRDPRLDLSGCATEDEEPVAFMWVEPRRDARYVVVEQPGYAEVYPVDGDLPVRMATTSGIEIEESRATVRLFEHDAKGALLRRYRLEAVVAG